MREMPDAPASTRDATGVRRVWAEVDASAITANTQRIAAAAPHSACCAIVKADGYGHGAVRAAEAAVAGGATWLGVVTADEAQELRDAGIDARILVLGPLTLPELERALAADADIVAWTDGVLDAAIALGGARVHVKLDTGMGRLGCRSTTEASRLLQRCADEPSLVPVGVMTHFATADELGDRFFGEQLSHFAAWVDEARGIAPGVIAHAANSAAILRDPPPTSISCVRACRSTAWIRSAPSPPDANFGPRSRSEPRSGPSSRSAPARAPATAVGGSLSRTAGSASCRSATATGGVAGSVDARRC